MGEDERRARKAFDNLIEAHVRDLLAASPKELAEDARAIGLDPEDEARRALDAFKRAQAEVGRRKMQAAKVELAAYRATPVRSGSRSSSAADARKLTMAARNGTGQSERDRKTVQDDLDELDAFDDGKAPD